jgi:DNA-binding CsgD family transcriptional regulator
MKTNQFYAGRVPVTASEPNFSGAEPVGRLTPRELEVVRLLGSGCTYEQVALRLGISPHTVVSHIKNAYRKLDVHNGRAAVMRALRLGLFQA